MGNEKGNELKRIADKIRDEYESTNWGVSNPHMDYLLAYIRELESCKENFEIQLEHWKQEGRFDDRKTKRTD